MSSSLWSVISQQIGAATHVPFQAHHPQPVGGGCINQAYVLDDGQRRFFVKTNHARQAAMFAAEAVGLNAIIQTRAIRAPRPICHGSTAGQAFLVLEYLPLHTGTARSASLLGEQLAALHHCQSERFGFAIDNTIGATPQINTWRDRWIDFYAEHRLRPQFDLAAQNGLRLAAQSAQLISRLPLFFSGYQPLPVLLHGDLWSGNWGSDENGSPVLFDPACYYGDCETDLAMTELFGAFPASFYAAYRACHALDPGYGTRKTLYQLYHILNHYNLFGGGYGAQAQRMLQQLIAEIS